MLEKEKFVLCICGYSCAGKTSAGTFLKSNFNFVHYEASDYVRTVSLQTLKMQELSMSERMQHIRQVHGPDFVASSIRHDILRSTAARHVITGFRLVEEIEFIRENYHKSVVLYLSADRGVRFERASRRVGRRAVSVPDDLFVIDNQDAGLGLLSRNPQTYSHFILENNGSRIEGFYHNLENLISSTAFTAHIEAICN
jgi:adenylate kinase family enzyme